MTKLVSIFSVVLLAATLLFSCKNEPKVDVAATSGPKVDTIKVGPKPSMEGARTYAVTEGVIYWAGEKAMGNSRHNGTINVKSGEFQVNQGQVLAGKVIFDMKSIAVQDLKDPGEKSDLESHLKDNDFFETNKFPEGTFVVEDVLPSNTPEFNAVISGSLTLKGKSNSINIPVKLTINGDDLSAESPTFMINRTKWGINFNSTVLNTAKDKLIADNIPMQLSIKAKAK
jgi:polyisoprenoid-binding protein YceI